MHKHTYGWEGDQKPSCPMPDCWWNEDQDPEQGEADA